MINITNKEEKNSFIGICLGSNNVTETAVAILDKSLNIITLDKLFSLTDIKYFFDTQVGRKQSLVCVTIPKNDTMISSKWKYLARTYHPVNLNSKIKNHDAWANRFSTRASDFLLEQQAEGLDMFRCDIDNLKKELASCYSFQDRTPIDCKTLQITLRSKFQIPNLPNNMLPVSQLEAILCAYFARMIVLGEEGKDFRELYEFCHMKVYGI